MNNEKGDEDDHDIGFVTLVGFVDPIGYLYCEKTGLIVKGGTISVDGPGLVLIFQDGSEGMYSWLAEPGVYTMSYAHPAGYPMGVNCLPQSGIFDPTGKDGTPADMDGMQDGMLQLGTNEISADGKYLVNTTCNNNPYYFTFDLAVNDPLIFANNIPISCGYISSCLLYTSPSPRDKRQSRMPSSA